MRDKLVVLLALILSLTVGCTVSTNGGDDDDDSDTGGNEDEVEIQWSWTIVDENAATFTCADVQAAFTRIAITDSAGESHELWWECSAASGVSGTGWGIATGAANVTIDLVTSDDVPLSTTTFAHEFAPGMIDPVWEVEFQVGVYDDPTVNGNATLTWEWRWAEGDVEDPWEDTTPFNATICEQLKIDYVNMWVWNDVWEQWWTDAQVTQVQCEAFDNPADDAIWGNEIYSGIFAKDFLQAGTYKFYLGFYNQVEGQEDVLLYYDETGVPGGIDGVLVETPDDDSNLWATIFDSSLIQPLGVLKINLIWHQTEGGYFDNCDNSNVDTMGFLLRNDGWVAAEVPLDEGTECLDWLTFEEVPILDTSYDLLITATAEETGKIMWHHTCVGMDPEVDVTPDTATGYTCDVLNQLEP